MFGTDMSPFVHVDDNKDQDIWVLGEGPTQGLYDPSLTAEAIYPINFTQLNKRFALSLHYNGSNSVLFVKATYKNLSIQSERLWNNIMYTVFR